MRKKKAAKKEPKVIGILSGDWHLRHTVPIARGETRAEWYQAQARYLNHLWQLGDEYQCPIFCAGDVLHKWDSPPELINFIVANTRLRGVISVAGNHDLPNHNIKDMERSGYQTLIELGFLNHASNELCSLSEIDLDLVYLGLSCGEVYDSDAVAGSDIKFPTDAGTVSLAIVHDLVWKNNPPYPNAPITNQIGDQAVKYKDFDVVLFGDNHQLTFDNLEHKTKDNPVIVNLGCLMPTRSDEENIQTYVGLLISDGTVEIRPIPTKIANQNKWRVDTPLDGVMDNSDRHELEDFLETARDLADVSLRFQDAIKQLLKTKELRKSVRSRLLEIAEEIKDD